MKTDKIAELAKELSGQMPADWYAADRAVEAAERRKLELHITVSKAGNDLADRIRRIVQYHVNRVDPTVSVRVCEHCNGYQLDWSIRPPKKSPYVRLMIHCGMGCQLEQSFWPVSKKDVQDVAIKLAQAVRFLKEIKSGRQKKI